MGIAFWDDPPNMQEIIDNHFENIRKTGNNITDRGLATLVNLTYLNTENNVNITAEGISHLTNLKDY